MTDGDLDTLAAERVMGWHPWHPWDPWEGLDRRAPMFARWGDGVTLYQSRSELSCDSGCNWSPSTSIADAWEVVEKLLATPGPNGDHHTLTLDMHQGHAIAVFDHMEDWSVRAEAETAPRAICLAALKAVGVEVPDAP